MNDKKIYDFYESIIEFNDNYLSKMKKKDKKALNNGTLENLNYELESLQSTINDIQELIYKERT